MRRWGWVVISLWTACAWAVPPESPDFTREPDRPWLVMVTQEDCSYCALLERDVLGPLRASRLFEDSIRFTEVDIGTNPQIIDFDGAAVSARAFATRYQAFGTPTLLYLDATGRPMAEPSYGIPGAIEFYGYAIEERLKSMAASR